MIKRAGVFLLTLIFVLCAAACCGGEEPKTTETPATEAPATDVPATDVPATEAPATEAPATDVPATEAPATEAPAADAREAYPIEENTGYRHETYPYLVRTPSAVWYLAADDIALLGEEAYYDGLYAILEYAEADFTDAREALKGYIFEEVQPVIIHTDFCGHEDMAKLPTNGYFTNGTISLYRGWAEAADVLLHEYVHYLTLNRAAHSTAGNYWRESVGEYVSRLVCRNRTADMYYTWGREDQLSEIEAEAKQYGFWDYEEERADTRKLTFLYAQMVLNGDIVGHEYFCIGQKTIVRTQEIQDDPARQDLMYSEAACMMAYLVEAYGRDLVFSNWNSSVMQMEDAFGKTFSELYHEFAEWNAEQCVQMGLITG